MPSLDSSDEVLYEKKGRHRVKRTPGVAFKMDGIALYLFSAFIIASVFLSVFILYDNFLYQNNYDKLMNIWVRYEEDQKGLDRLTNEITDRDITTREKSKKITKMREEINKNDEDLKKIGISDRHRGLVGLKKELALLTGDLYKIGKSKEEVISFMDNGAENKALLKLKEQNIKVFKKEEEVVNAFYGALPFERKFYEGLTPTSLRAAIKGL